MYFVREFIKRFASAKSSYHAERAKNAELHTPQANQGFDFNMPELGTDVSSRHIQALREIDSGARRSKRSYQLQLKYQEKFQNCSDKEVDAFTSNNPDPNKTTVFALINTYPDWKEAYNALWDCIKHREESDAIKANKIEALLIFPTQNLPNHLDQQFITERWQLLFILVSVPHLFNLMLEQGKGIRIFQCAAYNPNLAYYLCNTNDRFFQAFLKRGPNISLISYNRITHKRPELAVYLLRNRYDEIKQLTFSEQLVIFNKLADVCDIPVSARLKQSTGVVAQKSNDNVTVNSISPEEEGFLKGLHQQIEKWTPEKIMMITILSLFGHNQERLSGIIQKEPKGLSEEKIKKLVESVAQESLKNKVDQNGNTVFHLAYFYEARITIDALLREVAKSSDNAQQVITEVLIIENKEGEISSQLCSPEFAKEITNTVIHNILQEVDPSHRPGM